LLHRLVGKGWKKMIRLFFQKELGDLRAGVEMLMSDRRFVLSDDGIPILVEQGNETGILVSLDQHQGYIRYNQKIHFFRALGLFLEHAAREESFNIIEEPQFTMNGAMIDCSRNAVWKVESVKKWLQLMAIMGLNTLLVYMEDTYEIPDEPYFGYMRGRYTAKELKELDNFADVFGIEIIPCIQTLAHLSSFLRWEINSEIRDTTDILLAGSDKTYQLIEKMIRSASEPFRSNRIHIGMDEAHFLGRGNYLDLFGFESSFQIMSNHLKRVKEITDDYKLRPMIWSDMYFRLGSKDRNYYDLKANIPNEVKEQMPKDVQYVYWDYYHEDESFYQTYIQKHLEFSPHPIFAGGIWTWNGLTVHYDKTFSSTNAALAACKETGIKEVFATLWGDNGAETDPFTALLGLQLYAEHGYAREFDQDKLKARFNYCTGANLEAFLMLGQIDTAPGTTQGEAERPLETENPSKYLLWQDPLLGIFDKHVGGIDIQIYFKEMGSKLEQAKDLAGAWEELFDVPIQLCSVLAVKSELGIKLKKAYDAQNKNELEHIALRVLPDLEERVKRLWGLHYKQWMKTHKPFGWEVLDIRYGGLLARIHTAIQRIKGYLAGDITTISELEEERLSFFATATGKGTGRCNLYRMIASPNEI